MTNLFGDHPFGVDEHIDRHVLLAEQALAGQVGRRSNTGNFGRRSKQGVANLARDHVDFVTAGYCDQHVGVVGAGPAHDVGMRRLTGHGLDVDPFSKLREPGGIAIDQRHVKLFVGEVLGQGPTNLASTDNQDFHGVRAARRALRRALRRATSA